MTTQPELPEVAPLPARPALYVAPAPAQHDVDFDAFVRTYETRLRRLVLRRIGDLCEAEEITQETLLRAYQHRASFGSEDELMAWSTVVAQRLVIDRVRVRGRSVAVPEVPESARLGRDTAEIVVARHEARAALESLEAIPTRQAAILWAREVEGLHYEEIAERFGITEPAVRSLLHRGRKALRKEFKDRTGSLPLNGLVPFAPWLLALKAAGKLRGAAKTVARSSVTSAAALSLSALVAITGAGPFGGRGGSAAPDVRIDAGRGGATFVTAYRAEDAFDRVNGITVTIGAGGSGATAQVPSGPSGGPPSHEVRQCVPRTAHRCVTAGDDMEPFAGGQIQIGPDELPPNPLNQGNIVVASDHIDCSQLALPDNPAVKCIQNGPSQRLVSPESTAEMNPSSPSTSEGALR